MKKLYKDMILKLMQNNILKYNKYISKINNLIYQIGGSIDDNKLKIMIISYNESGISNIGEKNQFDSFYKELIKNDYDLIYVAIQEFGVNKQIGYGGLSILINYLRNKISDKYDVVNENVYDIDGKYIGIQSKYRNVFNADDVKNTKNTLSILFVNKNIKNCVNVFNDQLVSGEKRKHTIMTECNIKHKNNEYNICFINTHLPFGATKNGDFKYGERIKKFDEIVTQFDLVKRYENNAIIFICGDLNFRLHYKYVGNNADMKGCVRSPEHMIDCRFTKNDFHNFENHRQNIIDYYDINKIDQKNEYRQMFELYRWINDKIEKSTNFNNNKFYETLLKTIYDSVPTCRYLEKRNELIIKNDVQRMPYHKDDVNDNDMSYDDLRFPSNCDQILMSHNDKYKIESTIDIIDFSHNSDHLGIYRKISIS